jgi:PTH1 family peptidyl-tRNA hydrolase
MQTGVPVKLVVGLGNPGQEYTGTRHNLGFEVVDAIAGRHGLEWRSARADALIANWRARRAFLVKPLTYMNLSGHAVGELQRYYKVELADLLIIVDEIHLELGRLRTRASGSAGGHNGLKSLIAQLGTDKFPRMRIGVGRGDTRRDFSGHVLSRFDANERRLVQETVERATDAVELFVTSGIEPMMNRFNRTTEEAKEEDKQNERQREEEEKEDGV